MIKRLVYKIWMLARESAFRKKSGKIAANVKPAPLSSSICEDYLLRWRWTGKNQSLSYPRIYAGVNGISSSLYVPENVYYLLIEPVLNNRAYALSYSDKNFYESYLPDLREIFPPAVIRCINGCYYDHNYRSVDPVRDLPGLLSSQVDHIIKPAVETGGGSGLAVIRRNGEYFVLNGKEMSVNELIDFMKKVYPVSSLIQERIKQHHWFEGFNSSSVNTVRIFTYRSVKDNHVHILHSVIRFGREGSIVDNQAAGGLSCGVTPAGTVNNFAIDKMGTRYTGHIYLNQVKGQMVPGFERMKKIATGISPKYQYHRLLGFDFCLDAGGNVKLLEINCKNIEINFLQMNNGPLFRDLTDEIIEYCRNNRRSVVFDFYI